MGFIFFPSQYELEMREYFLHIAGIYGANNSQQQDQPVVEEMFHEAVEEKQVFDPNLQAGAEDSHTHPIDVAAIQGPDIEAYNAKMAELCDDPKTEEPDERHHENFISDNDKEVHLHPVEALIVKVLKEKFSSGVAPKEAYVKNGDIRELSPDMSRKAITKHFNALIKAKLIRRVDRIKYYLHSDNNH